MNRRFLKTAPLLVALFGGFWLLWTQTGRFFPVDRQIFWQPPSNSQTVRQLEVQIWQEGQLLKREVRQYPSGMNFELQQQVALKKGAYDVKAMWKREGAPEEESFSKTLVVAADKTLVISMP